MRKSYTNIVMALLVAIGLSGNAISQTTGTGAITGVVLNSETQQPLPGANIVVVGTVMGTAADENGEFRLDGLSPGEYAVQFTNIGYKARTDTVDVTGGESRFLRIELTPTALQSPQLVVTGSKRSVRVTESPVSIGTLSEDDLQLRMPTTLNEVLSLQPGVQMVGGDVNIRGSSGYTRGAGSRVLVLVDGVPLLASDNGGIYWDAVPTQNIERVEILKGPGSALYGSNALGGVINIITAPISRRSRTSVHLQGGHFSKPSYSNWQWRDRPLFTGKWSVQTERRSGKLGYRIGLGQQSSPGYLQNSWYRRWSVNGKFQYRPNSHQSWESRLFLMNDIHGVFTQWKSAHEPFSAPEESLGDYIINDKFQWALTWSNIVSQKLSHTWKTIYYRTAFQNYQHDNDDYSTSNRVTTNWQTDFHWKENHIATTGMEASFQRTEANIWESHTGYEVAGYLQDEWRMSVRRRMTFGIRADYSQIDDYEGYFQVNPKIGVNHQLTDVWMLRASLGRAFRVPSIAERFIRTRQNIFEVEPNPNLQPETSVTGEIGTHYEVSGFTADIAVFSSRYRDFIDPIQNPETGKISFQNITDAQISGAESTVEFRVPWIPVDQSVSYTFLHPRDVTMDTVLAYRHRHNVVTETRILWSSKLMTSIEYQYRSKVERVQLFPYNPKTGADKRVPIHLWSLNAAYRPTKALTLRLSVSNLFQYYYVMFERNMGAPRHVQIGIDYNF
ncbi:MAG: TonB-dependent receptor [Candidatus Marinimicrobia bacterium]|nr:TonB-dependent receptor [Candidatus Neomarinimicrobiota bacterium]MCF7827883.1 TonB-dependent receptor [Candidatus Neomarinimicrobiota bacterium]MCF7879362.1 TonB-dependent receptor [Candidatus Neomarinimicrobiota bacterium]